MNNRDIHRLLNNGDFPHGCTAPKLIETHISWVIVCDKEVFKIKKPIKYDFLDFSTLDKRKHYCEQELILNRRLTDGIYLDMVPICVDRDRFIVKGNTDLEIADYAVMMKRLEADRRMDVMLQADNVSEIHVQRIADVLIGFHKKADIIYERPHFDLHHDFDELRNEKGYLEDELGGNVREMLDYSLNKSRDFLDANSDFLSWREEKGFVRDCHGDLHSRNIFLYDDPIIFDCIEFNDSFRQIDILSELAFFCMDMEAFGKQNLNKHFIDYYNKHFRVIDNEKDEQLFTYFKAYRANVRAKVNSLRAKEANENSLKKTLAECNKYIKLMHTYLKGLESTK